jgi:hypothetical protein
LPGISTVAQLYGDYREAMQVAQGYSGLARSVGSLQSVQGILSQYGLPSITNGSLNPGEFGYQGNYQSDQANWQIAQTTLQQLQKIQQRIQQLQQQRDSALSSLQGATDASQVAKYHAALDALNAAIAQQNQQAQQLQQQVTLQNQQIQAAQNLFQTARPGPTEQRVSVRSSPGRR